MGTRVSTAKLPVPELWHRAKEHLVQQMLSSAACRL